MHSNTYRFEAIVLATKAAVPRIATAIWYRGILIAKPTVGRYLDIQPTYTRQKHLWYAFVINNDFQALTCLAKKMS